MSDTTTTLDTLNDHNLVSLLMEAKARLTNEEWNTVLIAAMTDQEI